MGRHKVKRIKLSTDENQVMSVASKDTKGSVEAVFIKYGGNDRCARCWYYDYEAKCRQVKCRAEERKDKRDGYFRAANVAQVEQTTNGNYHFTD